MLENPYIWGQGGTPVEPTTTNGMIYVSIPAINEALAGGTDE